MSDHPLHHLIFSHATRTVYAPVPKAACSSFKAYFRQAEGLPPLPLTQLHTRRRNGLTYADSIERSELIRILFAGQEGYFKFTVVRNPFSRLVSAYRDLVAPGEGGDPRLKVEVSHLLDLHRKRIDARPSEVSSLSFEAFIRLLPALPPRHMDRHWQPQVIATSMELIRYDMIVQLENLEASLPQIQSRMRLEAPMDLHLNRNEKTIDLREWYTPELADIVTTVYARDFRRLKYEPSVPT